MPGGKAAKPELDPAGKVQSGCAGPAEPGQSPRQGRPAAPAHPQPAGNVTAAKEPQWSQAGTSRLAGVHRDGEEPPPSSARQRDGREQGEVRGFPENKAAAGSQHRGEGESPAPLQLGSGKMHKKRREFVFYLPGNPSSITGVAQPKRPAAGGGETGAGAAASCTHGVTFGGCHSGVTGGPGSGAEQVTVHPLAALSAWLCFHHMAPSSLLGDRAQIPCARLVPGLGAATNTQPGGPGVPGQL